MATVLWRYVEYFGKKNMILRFALIMKYPGQLQKPLFMTLSACPDHNH